MKALLSHAPGGTEPLVLSEIPAPVPGAVELGLRVQACAINYPDVLIIEDLYRSRRVRNLGTVAECGSDCDVNRVDGFTLGSAITPRAFSS